MPDPEIPSQPSLPTGGPPQVPHDFVLLVVPLRKFSMGQMVITSNAQSVLTPEDVGTAQSVRLG